MDLLFVLIAGLIILAALDRGEGAARSRTPPVRIVSRANQQHTQWGAPSRSRDAK